MELSDIVNKKFNKLMVLCYSRSEKGRKGNIHFYDCECECGIKKEISRDRLLGGIKSCGCLIGNNNSDFDPEDIVGSKIGKLSIIRFDAKNELKCGRADYAYECLCECGKTIVVSRQNLKHSHTKSCGCLKFLSGKENKDWKGFGEISGRYWGHVQNHAKARGLEFSVSIEDAWLKFINQDRKCALSGVSIEFRLDKATYRQTASFDRIDSTLGYISGNVQWVHKEINLMKMNRDEHKFIEWCRLVCEHSKC